MKLTNTIALLFGILMIIPLMAASENKTPSCQKRQFQKFSIDGFQISYRDLPKSLLVARGAYLYFEDMASGQLKLKAYQSFISPESKIECASSDPKDIFSVNYTAPVLIDLSEAGTVGNSVWQFNVTSKGPTIGLWNQVSQLLSKNFRLEEWIANNNNQISFYQTHHDQFEMVIRSADKSNQRILVIYFDSVKGLE